MPNENDPGEISVTFAQSRKRFLVGVAILGAVIFVSYAIVNFTISDIWPAYLELALGIVCVLAIILIRYERTVTAALVTGALVIAIISIHNFGTGGFYSTGPFWIFMFPPIIFVLRGYRRGLIWLGAMFGVFLLIWWLRPWPDYFTLPYSDFFILMFLIVLAVVSVLIYFYQYSQEQSQRMIARQTLQLQKNNASLQRQIEEKEQAMKEMTEKQAEVEKLNRLMIGREIRMKEMKEEIALIKGKTK